MSVAAKCFFVIFVMLATANITEAQQLDTSLPEQEGQGSVIVFPKFSSGTLILENATVPQTQFQVDVKCPKGTTCPEDEQVKIRFHWVCPGSDDISSKSVCKEASFEIGTFINRKVSFGPDTPGGAGGNPIPSAPCSSGYLIGWVIDSTTGRPINYNGLSGSAVLRRKGGAAEKYRGFTIQAEPSLSSRAEIKTDVDPRTGVPAIVFDGAQGHYQALAAQIPQIGEYNKLPGPLSSDDASLVLLTLDVRLNRPNYPTFVDLNFKSDEGVRAGKSWNFRCWTEINNPRLDPFFTLSGARYRDRVILSGEAVKVPFGDISDIPGPVTLIGLGPAEEGVGRPSMDPVYVLQQPQNGETKAVTVLVPFN